MTEQQQANTQPAGPPDVNLQVYEQAPLPLKERAEQLIAGVDRAAIDSPAALAKASDLDKFIQSALKKLEDERTSWVGPLNGIVRRINARFKDLTGPLTQARGRLHAKMKAYNDEQERQAREAEEKRRREAEEAALAEAQEREAAGDSEGAVQVLEEAVNAPESHVPVASGPVRGDLAGTSSFVDHWVYEVENLDEVPREFLMIDDRKVREAIRRKEHPVRQISGLRIWNDKRVATR